MVEDLTFQTLAGKLGYPSEAYQILFFVNYIPTNHSTNLKTIQTLPELNEKYLLNHKSLLVFKLQIFHRKFWLNRICQASELKRKCDYFCIWNNPCSFCIHYVLLSLALFQIFQCNEVFLITIVIVVVILAAAMSCLLV